MIQFYHFHTSGGEYKDIISQPLEHGNKDPRIVTFSALSALRRENDTCFTYCPYEGKCYFLQTNSAGNSFAHGFIGNVNELDTDPTLYIDSFKREYDEEHEESINDAPLPIGKPFNTALYRRFPKIFGYVIETLLYSDKLVVLYDESKENLINFIKALYSLLPHKYRRTIGFCVAPDSVRMFLPDTITEQLTSIRVIAVTSINFYRQRNMAVFDFSDTDFSEYKNNPSERREYADVIEAYADDLACHKVLIFIDQVDSHAINDDGSINIAAMSGIAQTVLLSRNPSVKNCLYALEHVHEYDEFNEALALAVKTLLSTGEPSEEIIACVEKAISDVDIQRRNAVGVAESRAAYGAYVASSAVDWSGVSDFTLSCLIEHFKTRSSDDGRTFATNVRLGKRNKNAFNAFVRLYAETNYLEEILKLIVRYVDPDEIVDGNVDYGDDVFDDEKNVKAFTDSLFSIAGAMSNADDARRIVAALTVGCVRCNVANDNRDLRKESLKTFLADACKIVDGKKTSKKLFSSQLERIEHLIELHDYYMQCVHILGEDDTRDESAIKEIAEELFNGLPFSDYLYLYNKYPIIGFQCIKDIIYSELNNLNSVKSEIFKGDNYVLYKNFIEKEKDDFIVDERISDYVLSITDEQMREARYKELDAFRQSFNGRCYKYMGPKATANIIKETNQVIRENIIKGLQKNKCAYNAKNAAELMDKEIYGDAPFEMRLQKQILTEKLSIELGSESEVTVKNNSTERFRMYSVIATCCLAYMLLTILVFFVPQIVYAALLKCSILDRMFAMIDIVQILFVVYAGVVGAVSGLLLWKYTRHDRPTSIKFCNLYMIAFAVVPALCYEIAYSIMYVM